MSWSEWEPPLPLWLVMPRYRTNDHYSRSNGFSIDEITHEHTLKTYYRSSPDLTGKEEYQGSAMVYDAARKVVRSWSGTCYFIFEKREKTVDPEKMHEKMREKEEKRALLLASRKSHGRSGKPWLKG